MSTLTITHTSAEGHPHRPAPPGATAVHLCSRRTAGAGAAPSPPPVSPSRRTSMPPRAAGADATTRSAERAERHAAASDAAYARVRSIGDGIPVRPADTCWPPLSGPLPNAMPAACARRHRQVGRRGQGRPRGPPQADIAAAATSYRNNPITVANRNRERLRREVFARDVQMRRGTAKAPGLGSRERSRM